MSKISVIVPVYNEEEVLPAFLSSLKTEISKIEHEFEVILIDDGSTDGTKDAIKSYSEKDNTIKGISLSRNFGHQAALAAGIDHASGDAVICMDSDMQHPPELIKDLVEKWQSGYDIVYTIRKGTLKISFFKNLTAKIFYRIINAIAKVPVHENAADFRLISRQVANVLTHNLPERIRFTRGLISWVGFKSIGIEFEVQRRAGGKSKYSLRKMISLASSSLVSFSATPLRLGIYIGIVVGILSSIHGAYAIALKVFTDRAVSGWASLLTMVSFIGAVQFFLIGLIGYYLGYVFEEIKNRPVYIIKDFIDRDK